MEFLDIIKREWPVLSAAPLSVATLMVAAAGLAFALGCWISRQTIANLKERVAYLDDLSTRQRDGEPDSAPLKPLGWFGLKKHAKTNIFTLNQWACLLTGYEPCKPLDPLKGYATGVSDAFGMLKRLKSAILFNELALMTGKGTRSGGVTRDELRRYFIASGQERPKALFPKG